MQGLYDLALLAEGGIHDYHGVGVQLLRGGMGAAGKRGFVGGRLLASALATDTEGASYRANFLAGYGVDLMQRKEPFVDANGEVDGTERVGQATWSLGVGFSIWM